MSKKSCMLGLFILLGLTQIDCRRRAESHPKESQRVVVYTALDRSFSEPILRKFQEETGIEVLAKYDTESTKTVGLVNAIRAEKARPRCDVFWNNEIVNTMRLKEEGLLQPCRPETARSFPETFKDPDGYWYGLAARARVLLVNTDLVAEGEEPASILDLAKKRWKGRTGIAKPLFGTTATHVACLFAYWGEEETESFLQSLLENQIQIHGGNKQVALAVSEGRLAWGLTDTDDAIIEVERGKPVKMIYPDGTKDGVGVLFIPNTLSLVKEAPHPDEGKRLIGYLLSPKVEQQLAEGASAQIPLNPQVQAEARVKTPKELKSMEVDFEKAACLFEKAAATVEEHFLL